MQTLYPTRKAFWILALLLFLPASFAEDLDLQQRLQRAQALEQSGKLEEAIEAYQKIASQDPQSVQAQSGVGRAYYRSRQFPEAAASFERALEIQGDDPEILRWLAKSYLRADEPQKVIEVFSTKAAEKDDAWIHLLLARAYDAQDRTEKAMDELHRSLALDPHLPEAHFAMGFIAWSTRDLARAEEEFKTELSLNPHHTASWYYLFDILLTKGKLAEADTILIKLARQSPNAYLTHFGLAKMEERKDNFQGAANHYRRAIEIEPDHPEAHYRLAVTLRKLGRAADAKEAFERSRRLQSHSVRSMTPHGMGRMRLHLPEFEE